jgi:hypothetical protein
VIAGGLTCGVTLVAASSLAVVLVSVTFVFFLLLVLFIGTKPARVFCREGQQRVVIYWAQVVGIDMCKSKDGEWKKESFHDRMP